MEDIEYVIFAVDCDQEYWMDCGTYWYDAKVIDFKQGKLFTVEWRGTQALFSSNRYSQDPFTKKVAKTIVEELSNGRIYQFDIGDFKLQGKPAGKVYEKEIESIDVSENQNAFKQVDTKKNPPKREEKRIISDVQFPTGISAGNSYVAGLQSDGRVITAVEEDAYDWDKLNVSDWNDITMISAGPFNIIGLKSDQTVVSTSIIDGDFDYGQAAVNEWKDIVMVSAGNYHTVGLRANGTVISTTVKIPDIEVDESVELDLFEEDYGQAKVEDWEDVVMIAAGEYHTVGLKSDGTVVSTTVTEDENDRGQTDIDGWEDIIMVSANEAYTVGLKSDGTVVATTITDEDYDYGQSDVDDWNNIIMIAAGETHTVGLRSDGTVITTQIIDDDYDFGQTNVDDWDNIIAVAAGYDYTIGLKEDGSVVITESDDCEISVDNWTDIVNPGIKK